MPDNDFMSNIAYNSIRSGSTSELLTSFDWDFEFKSVPLILSDYKDDTLNKLMRGRTIAVQPPEDPTNQPISVMIHGHRFQQIGDTPAYGQFVITVQDFSDLSIQRLFTALMYSASDPETKAVEGAPGDYLFDMNIYRLDPRWRVVKAWRCHNCLVQMADSNEQMTGDKQPVGSVTISISVDQYTVEFLNGAASETNTSTMYDLYGSTLNTGTTSTPTA